MTFADKLKIQMIKDIEAMSIGDLADDVELTGCHCCINSNSAGNNCRDGYDCKDGKLCRKNVIAYLKQEVKGE